MRTQDEIQRQIDGLKKEKESLPQYNFFGDDNWGKIDAQLDILEGIKNLEDFEDDDDLYNAAEEADYWLNNDNVDDLF